MTHFPPMVSPSFPRLISFTPSARGVVWSVIFIDFIYPMQGELSGAFPLASGLVSSNFRYPLCKEFSTLLALVALFWNLTVQFFLLGYFSFSFLEPDSSGLFVALFFVYLGKFSKRWLRYFFFRSPQRVSLSPLGRGGESQWCWLFRSLTVHLITLCIIVITLFGDSSAIFLLALVALVFVFQGAIRVACCRSSL